MPITGQNIDTHITETALSDWLTHSYSLTPKYRIRNTGIWEIIHNIHVHV